MGFSMRGVAGLVGGIGVMVLPVSLPAAASTSSTAACTWVVNELPLPAGWTAGYVNNSDRDDSFTGYGVDADGKTRPLVWHDGAVTVLEAPGGVQAVAQDVNSRGDVVGITQEEGTPNHGVLWRGGQVIDLPVLPGGDWAVPTAINDSGLIAGYGTDGENVHATVWSTGSPRSIKDLGGMGGSAYLTDVNQRGAVVGWSETFGEEFRQQAIAGTVRGGLKALPGAAPGTNSMARAVASRYVVGVAVLAGSSADLGSAVVWSPTGARALPGTQPDARAVNDSGTAAGTDSDLGAVIWIDGQEQVLPALVAGNPFANSATVVTNHNTAAGVSADAQGNSRPVTWSCTS